MQLSWSAEKAGGGGGTLHAILALCLQQASESWSAFWSLVSAGG